MKQASVRSLSPSLSPSLHPHVSHPSPDAMCMYEAGGSEAWQVARAVCIAVVAELLRGGRVVRRTSVSPL